MPRTCVGWPLLLLGAEPSTGARLPSAASPAAALLSGWPLTMGAWLVLLLQAMRPRASAVAKPARTSGRRQGELGVVVVLFGVFIVRAPAGSSRIGDVPQFGEMQGSGVVVENLLEIVGSMEVGGEFRVREGVVGEESIPQGVKSWCTQE